MAASYVWNRPQFYKRKEEVAKDERDVTGQIIIVTGSNHGIGKQTALELAKRGAQVVMACRDVKKAEAAKEDIRKEVPKAKLEIMRLDLGDSSSVREFSKIVHETFSHIDVLINNAGIYKFDGKLQKTKDGFEEHIGVNHLNTFLLTLLLLDLLAKSNKSRIVNLSSMIAPYAELDVKNLNLENVNPAKHIPYANSKLANILFTKELARRLGDSNITVYALCPGAVFTEKIEDKPFLNRLFCHAVKYFFMFDLEEGSRTTLHCTLSKSLEKETGKMYRLLDVWDLGSRVDDQQAKELWEKSEELVGIKFQKP
jgi:NAD(P)-dependent dehydrogenase (short-subunit alcohol dehydrogenase family)